VKPHQKKQYNAPVTQSMEHEKLKPDDPRYNKNANPQNGKTRLVETQKAPKFYPADDVPVKVVSKVSAGVAKLKKTIKPGSVLILLAGRFRGKRVVFLKQLPSGLLLVTGPYGVNGVPLRRVNQSYVISTSTTVDVSKVDSAKFEDSYFGKPKTSKKAKKSESEFFGKEEEKAELDPARIADQKKVDDALKMDPMVGKYLKARFSLSKRDAPHKLVF
jgi:large subunit ribosomal protein L6e